MKYEQWVITNLQVGARYGDEFLCTCVFHDDHNASMCVNAHKGVFICYSCRTKGPLRMVAAKIRKPLTTLHTTESVRRYRQRLSEVPTIEEVRALPDDWLKQFAVESTSYWHGRGLTPSSIAAWGLGYDRRTNSATIPIRDLEGRLLGVIRRRLAHNAVPRYLYPKGFKISWHLFGMHRAIAEDVGCITITEGSIDAMLLWQIGYPAVALLGSRLSPHQFSLLKQRAPDRIIVCMDNDEAGGEASANVIQALAAEPRFSVRKVVYRAGDRKDPGEMSKADRKRLMEEAVGERGWQISRLRRIV